MNPKSNIGKFHCRIIFQYELCRSVIYFLLLITLIFEIENPVPMRCITSRF